eukprot:COSAG05_NODE_4467_length_1502_cov_1.556664_1_plen_354_part_10
MLRLALPLGLAAVTTALPTTPGLTAGSHVTLNDRDWAQPGGPTFDCAMRKLALSFGKQLRPDQGSFTTLYEALDLNNFNGSSNCKSDPVEPTEVELAGHIDFGARLGIERVSTEIPDGALFVAPDGDDSAPGTRSAPLASIQLACDRATLLEAGPRTVVLRGGTHFLPETIYLGPQHSELTLMSHPGEKAVVSGGKPLTGLKWTKAPNPARSDLADANIWVADVTGVSDVPGLQIDGARATRARYPNIPGGIETSCGYGCMVNSNAAEWTPPDFNRFGPVTYYTDNQTKTARHDTPSNWFQHYSVGVNGLCSVYTPPVSYWCSEHTAGGGAFAFRTPIGITPKKGALPHAPYKS